MSVAVLKIPESTGGFQQFCRARELQCNVTQNAEQTEYSISDGHRVSDAEASGCFYSWANASNNVLAHEEDTNPDLVVKTGVNDLITYTCFDKMVFKRLCKSEGKGYTAYCLTNCTLDSSRRPVRHNEMSPAGITGILVLVGFCLFPVALCLRFRQRIHRMCSSIALRRTNACMQRVSQRDPSDVVANIQ
ncbi:hypothetical protein PBY51_010400 [Eleginops maclovinus]|uniref:Uncharacterized protein n=1 Tax=Eleginops maclovinus TaxID=56733 RepID=A0AAN7X7N4_ELEMC|nr:hypothetical protein PBY51_010400 [Eleginops maclovinus]